MYIIYINLYNIYYIKIIHILYNTFCTGGNAVALWLRCCATNRKVAGLFPARVIEIFHWHKILLIALWPWGRLSLKQKWVPGAFHGGKDGRCVRLTTLPPSCAVVTKSGNLNFLEHSGPLQACNGTDLPLHFILFIFKIIYSFKTKSTINKTLTTHVQYLLQIALL